MASSTESESRILAWQQANNEMYENPSGLLVPTYMSEIQPRLDYKETDVPLLYSEIDLSKLKSGTLLEVDKNKQHNRIVCVTGVSACGKSYLLGRSLGNAKVNELSIGTLLSASTGVERDEIKDMAFDDYVSTKESLTDRILNQQPCVLDTHLVTKHRGVWVVLEDFYKKLNPEHFIVIIGDAKEIDFRRRQLIESGRNRDLESEEIMDLHQRMTIYETLKIAKETGAGVTLVVNTMDNTKRNLSLMKKPIASIAKAA